LKEYIISDNVRNKLKTPLGKLIENNRINRKYLLNIIKSNQTITIGDATTEKFIKYNIPINISVFDSKEKRVKREPPLINSVKFYKLRNPQGCITQDSIELIKNCLKINDKVQIIVEGEEDLLTLLFTAIFPINTMIFYGQPNKGLVIVKINNELRKYANKLLNEIGIKDYNNI